MADWPRPQEPQHALYALLGIFSARQVRSPAFLPDQKMSFHVGPEIFLQPPKSKVCLEAFPF